MLINRLITRRILVSRCFSSLGSPMFPQRPVVELTTEQLEGKSSNDDFLSKHGGKVAFTVFVGLSYLIYSYVKGGKLRTKEEEKAEEMSVINPDEINELRSANNISERIFNKLIVSSYKSIPVNNSDILSYAEFIRLVGNVIKKPAPIQKGYLLDRVAYSTYLQTLLSNQPITPVSNKTIELPLNQWLVILSLAVREPALSRSDSLYLLGRCMSGEDPTVSQDAQHVSLLKLNGIVRLCL